jgi:hypothetical protein
MNQSLTVRNLAELFDAGFRFRIPSYQRAYSWDVKQLRQLIEDLKEHPSGSPYYFGHFLFEAGESQDELLIIDGQQRLTTLVLLISCISREVTKTGEVGLLNTTALNQRYLANKLETILDDQPAFEDLVQCGETADRGSSLSRKRMIDSIRFFSRALRQSEAQTIPSWCRILENAEITTFIVHSKPQAAQIFTLQNSRGKDLTNLEELKAYLMFNIYLNAESKAADKAIGMVEQSFADIYRHIERIHILSEDAVLAHHDRAYSPHWGTPLENLKRDIATAGERAPRVECIVRYARDLQYTFQHVAALEQMLQHDEVIASPVILDGVNSWPLLIKLYRYYGDQLSSDSRLKELLENVEIVLLKLRFQHASSSNDLIRMTKHLNGSLESLAAMTERMRDCVSRGFRGRNDFDEKVWNYLNGDHHYEPKFRYILWKYENSLRQSVDHQVSPADFISINSRRMESTIEHIAPQNGDYTDEFRQRCINNLGNLLFMPRGLNSSLSDLPPLEKAKRMDTSYASHRSVKRTIEAEGQWAEHQIVMRKAEIVCFIQDRWCLPKTGQPQESAIRPRI